MTDFGTPRCWIQIYTLRRDEDDIGVMKSTGRSQEARGEDESGAGDEMKVNWVPVE
jgi:hypothetical protein